MGKREGEEVEKKKIGRRKKKIERNEEWGGRKVEGDIEHFTDKKGEQDLAFNEINVHNNVYHLIE